MTSAEIFSRMTCVTLFWKGKNLVGLESRGHAESGCKGEDVVCAAVSALVQALLVGLRDVANVSDIHCEMKKSVPLIHVRWPEGKAPELDLLTRTIAFSLREIASGYAGYVSIAEVQSS